MTFGKNKLHWFFETFGKINDYWFPETVRKSELHIGNITGYVMVLGSFC